MIPRPYQQMHQSHPDYMQAYEAFGKAAKEAGPLSDREVALVKLAISIGAGLEGAAHSHCRKAIEAAAAKRTCGMWRCCPHPRSDSPP